MKKHLTLTNFLLIGVILFLIYQTTCNKKVVPDGKPQVIPVTTQAGAVRVDSIASAKFVDSVNKIVVKWKSEADRWESNWNREVTDNAELQKTVGSILNEIVPDTCLQYQKKAIEQYNRLLLSSAKKDTSCSNTISALKNVVTQKDVLIKRKSDDWIKLKSNFDTALAQQKILQDYANKVRVRRELYLSVMALGNQQKFINGYGLGIGYRGKNGTAFEIGAMQIGPTINYSISVKKPLIRF